VDFELELLHDFTESERMMTVKFTSWEAEEGGFEGHLDDYPDFWTQGETLDELKRGFAWGQGKLAWNFRPSQDLCHIVSGFAKSIPEPPIGGA